MESGDRGLEIGRRRFLWLVVHSGWVAALGVIGYQIGRFLGAGEVTGGGSAMVAAGALEEYEAGRFEYVAGARAWVRREGDGVLALDAVCPHLGCLVRESEEGKAFYCPCHGSRFGEDGVLLQGPATAPLRKLDVEVVDGVLVLRQP